MQETCLYGVPLTFDGSAPSSTSEYWNFSSSTCTTSMGTSTTALGFNPTTTIATTSDIVVYGYFSSGEVLVAFFLFCIILLQLFSMLATGLSKINLKKKWLAYGGGDVEIKEN